MSANKPFFFHFTLGPVQGFVAQARRTRDFWAGSFLLSWLAGVAIAATQAQKGEINFPEPDETYLNFITGKKNDKEAPQQGGIPNRFKALWAQVPADFNAELVVQAVKKAWKSLADQIWAQDFENHLPPAQKEITKAIWDRQNENFWEISWVLTESDATNLVDRRKNWRTHTGAEEPGVKCTLMDGYQELSGTITPHVQTLNQFWNPLRKRVGTLDLGEGEKLCALAYIKRRFYKVFPKLAVPLDHLNQTIYGWKVSPRVPSLSYIAAAHWWAKALEYANVSDLNALIEQANQLSALSDSTTVYGDNIKDIHCVENAYKKQVGMASKLQYLEGGLFFADQLESVRLDRIHAADEEKRPQIKAIFQKVTQTLGRICKTIEATPSPFYAILLMDGDSLGSHMSKRACQPVISSGLNKFTQAVPEIVKNNNGFLVYAGGDDVLALLPLEDALKCAAHIRTKYLACFEDAKNEAKTTDKSKDEIEQIDSLRSTISAAIQFVHVKVPLKKVLADAHRLLDDEAKDGCGRDAVAVQVWKPGGINLRWAQPWEIALNASPKAETTVIEEIAHSFVHDDPSLQLSNGFFYKIHDKLNFFKADKTSTKEEQKKLFESLITLLAVDYANSMNYGARGRSTHVSLLEAKTKIAQLVNQCTRYKRFLDNPAKPRIEKETEYQADGALVIRFLAQKGVHLS